MQMNATKRSAKMNPDSHDGFDITSGALDKSGRASKPTHEEISVLAHQIHEKARFPTGRAEAHWHGGERRLLQESNRDYALDAGFRRA